MKFFRLFQKPKDRLRHLHPRLSEWGLVPAQHHLPADRVGGHGGPDLGVCVGGRSHALLSALLFHLDGCGGSSPVPAAD